jgi:FKBP-type peptidyl-prolyl cis-trans isomerase
MPEESAGTAAMAAPSGAGLLGRRSLVQLSLQGALALAVALAPAARADQEPAADATAPGPAPAFPLSAFSGLGSSFAQGSHLTELNWSDEQAAAFVDGFRAAFAGRPFPSDDSSKNLGAELARPLADLGARAAAAELARVLPSAPRSDKEPAAEAKAPGQAAAYPPPAYSGLGSSLAQGNHFTELGWSDEQAAAFIDGLKAAFAGRPFPFDDNAKNLSFEMGKRARQLEAQAKLRSFGAPGNLEKYLQSTGRRLKLDESDSGLWFSIRTAGRGDRPLPDDSVVISCSALAPDVKTKLPGLSAEHYKVRVSELLPGLREGVQMMAVGSEGTFLVPPKLSFGDGAWPSGVEKDSPIIFRVTLENVVRGEPPK